MGMTIEDCIDELQKLKLPISKHDLSFHFVEHTRNKTVETAIDTMRKYQKIEEILDQLIDSKIRTYDAVIEIEDIVYGQTEVDDGKDD